MADKKTDVQTNDPDTLTTLSRDVEKSTYKKNPDPNPDNVTPAPGPSTVQELGKP